VELGVDVLPWPWWRGGGGCVRFGDVACVPLWCAGPACVRSCRCCGGTGAGMAATEREAVARQGSFDRQLVDAAKCGDVAGISLALRAGANVNAGEGTDRMTPLTWAACSGHIAAVEALMAAGAHVDGADRAGETALMHAAHTGRTMAVACLLSAGADVHRVNRNGVTALHLACSWGNARQTRNLLEAGARTDVADRRGRFPIDVVRAVLRCIVVFSRA